MRHDLMKNTEAKVAVPNTAIAGNGTTAGNVIDTLGFESLTFLIVGGTLTDGTYTPLINHSDASNMSGEEAVSDDFLIGTEAEAALAAADDDNNVKRIGYAGKKRYVTCDIVATGVSSGGNVSVIAVLGHPKEAPVAQG